MHAEVNKIIPALIPSMLDICYKMIYYSIMYSEIKWHKRTLKQLSKIPHKERSAIVGAVKNLLKEHGERQVKALTNHEYDYRLRVGRYRVFFDIEHGEIKIYLIQEVKKRDEHTY